MNRGPVGHYISLFIVCRLILHGFEGLANAWLVLDLGFMVISYLGSLICVPRAVSIILLPNHSILRHASDSSRFQAKMLILCHAQWLHILFSHSLCQVCFTSLVLKVLDCPQAFCQHYSVCVRCADPWWVLL